MNPSPVDQISRKAVWGLKWIAPAVLLILVVGLASTPTSANAHSRKSAKKKPGVPGVQLPPEFTEFLRRGL
jgi:hypothetical protein